MNRRGYTLVELLVVLVILSVMAAVVVPYMTGFIENTRAKSYVLEAQGVRRSIECYLIDHSDAGLDPMAMMLQFSSASLDSPENPLSAYLTVRCTKGARLEGMTIDMAVRRVTGIIYRVRGYRIEIIDERVSIERPGRKAGM